MPRPKRFCRIGLPPLMKGFKPFGTPVKSIEPVKLHFEEFEALRLADYNNYSQETAARKMGVSRPTFSRIYDRARKKISVAFVENKPIFIEGGQAIFEHDWYRCNDCYHTFSAKKIKGQQIICPFCQSNEMVFFSNKKHVQKQKGTCYCTHCNTTLPHERGVPCRIVKCPDCGSHMIRRG